MSKRTMGLQVRARRGPHITAQGTQRTPGAAISKGGLCQHEDRRSLTQAIYPAWPGGFRPRRARSGSYHIPELSRPNGKHKLADGHRGGGGGRVHKHAPCRTSRGRQAGELIREGTPTHTTYATCYNRRKRGGWVRGTPTRRQLGVWYGQPRPRGEFHSLGHHGTGTTTARTLLVFLRPTRAQ